MSDPLILQEAIVRAARAYILALEDPGPLAISGGVEDYYPTGPSPEECLETLRAAVHRELSQDPARLKPAEQGVSVGELRREEPAFHDVRGHFPYHGYAHPTTHSHEAAPSSGTEGSEGLDHDLVPFPARGAFAETRVIYCRRCGASRPVGSSSPESLPPCIARLARASEGGGE
jgi:hypothetical protein